MDERVIDVPKWFRSFLVKGIILKTRPKKSAKAYKKIWWDEGSPLIVLSERLHEKVAKKTSVPISLAMRYGQPSIASGLEELHQKGVDEVLIVPLNPQHAMATTETILVWQKKLGCAIPKNVIYTFARILSSRRLYSGVVTFHSRIPPG